MKFSTLVAAAAMSLAAGMASATTIYSTFDLTGHLGLQDELGFEQDGLRLTATGHLLNGDGSIGSLEKIGQYSNGVGVTNDDEFVWDYKWKYTSNGWEKDWYKKYTDAHFVDGKGFDEVVKFVFDKVVKIEKIWFSYNEAGDDFAFTVLDGANAGAFYATVGIPGTSFYSSFTFTKEILASMFGVGATGKYDEFKIKKIKVSYEDHPEVIPLPAAGWLMVAGLGGLAALRRKKNAV
jgi:hypothetical protein